MFKKNLIYCVSVAVLAMVVMFAGQASAGCKVEFDGEELEIKCGRSDDDIDVFRSGDDLMLDLGSGAENLGSALNLKDIDIETGRGDDDVNVRDGLELTDSVEIKTGRGDDLVRVANVTIGDDLKIETGKGTDDVVLLDLDVADSIRVKTGKSDDIVTAGGTSDGPDVVAGNNAEFNGGRGQDTFNGKDEVVAGTEVKIKSFKTVNP